MKKITFCSFCLFLIGISLSMKSQTSAERLQFYNDYKNAVNMKTAIIKADPAKYQEALSSGWFQQVQAGLKNAEDYANGINAKNGGSPDAPASGNALCANATPFCTQSGSTFPASINSGQAEVGPNYGCLAGPGLRPNPAWFYLKILTSGTLQITETNSLNRDVDFVLWGPFSGPTCGAALTPTRDCGSSFAATEIINVGSCLAGEYYMLLITNWSNTATDITLTKTGGTAETDCGIVPASIPTLSEWGLIILGFLFLATGTMFILRRS